MTMPQHARRREALLTAIALGEPYKEIAKRFGLKYGTVRQYACTYKAEVAAIRSGALSGDLSTQSRLAVRAERIREHERTLEKIDAHPERNRPAMLQLRSEILQLIAEEMRTESRSVMPRVVMR